MANSSSSVNSGVHTSTGIEFQKHCALFLLFEKYPTIKEQKYFICLEHHDDFLFCYLTPTDIITSIDAYQSKKASGQWTMGKNLSEILKKLTQVGLDLLADTHPKDPQYSHNLRFITNDAISLNCGKRKNPKKLLINAGNNNIKFLDIDSDIQQNILNGLQKQAVTASDQVAELDKLSLLYVDLPKTARSQKDNLVGQFQRIFGSNVNDPSAAVDALLLLFRGIENTLNQENVAKLLDKSKRLESSEIAKAMKILTTQAKAYDLWRQRGDDIAQKLSISVFERDRFKLQFQNSLDLFKDLKQKEHQSILKYVQQNKARWFHHINEVACIEDIYNCFKAEKSSNLNEFELKAAIYAGYLEIRG
jgi:hypothetical protein